MASATFFRLAGPLEFAAYYICYAQYTTQKSDRMSLPEPSLRLKVNRGDQTYFLIGVQALPAYYSFKSTTPSLHKAKRYNSTYRHCAGNTTTTSLYNGYGQKNIIKFGKKRQIYTFLFPIFEITIQVFLAYFIYK
jgi:hypothetical protein